MKTYTQQCTDAEVSSVELKWQSQGFRLVYKNDTKDLLPFEYLKTAHKGTETSIGGPRAWTLTRKE
jgi:hypothetical protein